MKKRKEDLPNIFITVYNENNQMLGYVSLGKISKTDAFRFIRISEEEGLVFCENDNYVPYNKVGSFQIEEFKMKDKDIDNVVYFEEAKKRLKNKKFTNNRGNI